MNEELVGECRCKPIGLKKLTVYDYFYRQVRIVESRLVETESVYILALRGQTPHPFKRPEYVVMFSLTPLLCQKNHPMALKFIVKENKKQKLCVKQQENKMVNKLSHLPKHFVTAYLFLIINNY